MVQTGRAFPLKNQLVSFVRKIPERFAGFGLCKNLLCTVRGCCLIHSDPLAPASPAPFWSFEISSWKSLGFFILSHHLTEIRGNFTG